MSTEELGCRMNNYICTMLNGTKPVGCTEGIIYNEWNIVLMSNLSQSINIRDITVGVT